MLKKHPILLLAFLIGMLGTAFGQSSRTCPTEKQAIQAALQLPAVQQCIENWQRSGAKVKAYAIPLATCKTPCDRWEVHVVTHLHRKTYTLTSVQINCNFEPIRVICYPTP